MMLQNKNAVIYGAAGSLGGAVARAFAKGGARVFVTGRHLSKVKKLAEEIIAGGGHAVAAQVDAMDKQAINSHLDEVVAQAGSVDISFNAVGLESVQDIPLTEMKLEDFLRPVHIAMTTQFLTATAAARIMIKQASGVILSLTATPGGVAYPYVGGFGPACCAIESFSRDLAAEVGPHGVRVINMRSAGSPDSRVFQEAVAGSQGELAKAVIQKLANDTMLKKLPLIDDIANVALFLSSGMAGKITGVTIDVTSGTSGINHKTTAIPFK